MNLKLGDLVFKRNEEPSMLYEITEFGDDFAVLKGTRIPVITVADFHNLIKINNRKRKNQFKEIK